jgi:hypothetical protein
MEDDLVWETLIEHEDYEIATTHPYQIRRKEDQRIVPEQPHSRGYVGCHLSNKSYLKHRIIAIHFIPNPRNLPQVDHKNKIRNDNRIENLRWVTLEENMKNLKSMRGFEFEYFEDLPVPCESFDFYNGHDFEGYSIDSDMNMYYHNGLMFRKLQRLLKADKYQFYAMRDIEGKQINVFLNKIE